MAEQTKDKPGVNQEGGLGGNRLPQERSGSSVDETDLTDGERRRGGQSPEPKESAYATNE